MIPVYKKGRLPRQSGIQRVAWAQACGMKGQKFPSIKRPEGSAERVQGVARIQVFGMKGQNWVRLAKTR
jgi:hypothetical protein